MRISDWSSDVCSSDLGYEPLHLPAFHACAPAGVMNSTKQSEYAAPAIPDSRFPNPGSPLIAILAGEDSGDQLGADRSEEHTSELQSLLRISYAVFCLQKYNHTRTRQKTHYTHT